MAITVSQFRSISSAMPSRRTLIRLAAATAALGTGGSAYATWKSSRNPYYDGPVSDHFDGVRFFNPGGKLTNGFRSFLRWQTARGGKEAWPEAYPGAAVTDKPPAKVEGGALRVSFVGHASLLVQTAGLNILFDPVWSERASPVSFTGPKRVNPPGIAFDDLPRIDWARVSHTHYDHLDLETLTRLHDAHVPRIVTPLGNDAIMKSHDGRLKVTAKDWGERVDLAGDVALHLAPAHHWSARGMLDRRMALWAAFVLTTPHGNILLVGDSGFHDGIYYRQIAEKFGPFRFSFLPIGAYEPRWFMAAQHQNPDEAVQAHKILRSAATLGHHWGTFKLTDEGIERPLEALDAARDKHGVSAAEFFTLRPGEVWQPPTV
ncbi:MAG: MBL fold metallo-hydrolase [Beijerinckiaceae bacterium]